MNVQKNPQFNQFSRMKIRQENLKNNTMMSFVIGVVITLIIACIGFYFFLPAINFKSIQFWAFLLGVGAVYLIVQDSTGISIFCPQRKGESKVDCTCGMYSICVYGIR